MVNASECPLKTLTDEVGGENQINFIVMGFCELVRNDPNLQIVFKGMELERMVSMMTTLINMVFSYTSKQNIMPDETARSRIIMRNYTLFELGMRPAELKQLQDHFESALHDSWIEGSVFDQCVKRFEVLRVILEEEGLGVPYSNNDSKVRSLTARSA